MKKTKLITILLCFLVVTVNLYSQNTANNKPEYKFVFVFNDIECTNCYVKAIEIHVKNIQNQFKDNNECYIIMQVRKIGDASIYRNYIKNATIIETTEKLDFSNCGITKFPGLICYKYEIPFKIYNNISQQSPTLVSKMFDGLCRNINKFKHIPLIENDSVGYTTFSPTSAIYNDKLYCVDEMTFKLHKININTGILESSFNLEDTAISNALLEDEFKKDEYSIYRKDNSILKIYGCFFSPDKISIITLSSKRMEFSKRFVEEYNDSMISIKNITTHLLLSIDTNYNYTFKEFNSKNIYSRTKHNFSWDIYVSNNNLLVPLLPDNKNIGDTVYLLAKYDINKFNESDDYKLICPYIINKKTTESDYVLTQKIIDNYNDDIFVINSSLNLFSKIDVNYNKTDFSLQGSYAVDNYSYNDTNINKVIKKNNNIVSYSKFLEEKNDSLLVTGIVYNVSYTHKILCVQTYNKKGKFIKEKIYNLEGVSRFNYSGIYNNNLVFIYRKDSVYNLVFVPMDEEDPEKRRAIYPIKPMDSCPTDYGLEMELERIKKENQKNKIKEQ